jgi:hypothetical protein
MAKSWFQPTEPRTFTCTDCKDRALLLELCREGVRPGARRGRSPPPPLPQSSARCLAVSRIIWHEGVAHRRDVALLQLEGVSLWHG